MILLLNKATRMSILLLFKIYFISITKIKFYFIYSFYNFILYMVFLVFVCVHIYIYKILNVN